MENMASQASVECWMMFDIVFVGLVVSTGYGAEAAQRFLEDMHKAITDNYQDNLDFIRRQPNLYSNIYDKKLNKDFIRIYKNNDTGI